MEEEKRPLMMPVVVAAAKLRAVRNKYKEDHKFDDEDDNFDIVAAKFHADKNNRSSSTEVTDLKHV